MAVFNRTRAMLALYNKYTIQVINEVDDLAAG